MVRGEHSSLTKVHGSFSLSVEDQIGLTHADRILYLISIAKARQCPDSKENPFLGNLDEDPQSECLSPQMGK